MSVVIAMLRGVNVGGNNLIKMEALRALCESLKCTDVATYVQSGNVVFRTAAKDIEKLRTKLESTIASTCGFAAPVVFRTVEDLQRIVSGNPFQQQAETEPGKVHVTFLYHDPGDTRRAAVRAMAFAPEEVRIEGREVYLYYPLGAGQSKLRWGPIERALGTAGTSRNWNTVVKLLAMGKKLED